MFRSTPHVVAHRIEGQTPVRGLLVTAALFALILFPASLYTFGSATVPLAVFGAAVTVAAYGLVQGYPHPVLGLCNVITLLRVALVAFLVGTVLATDVSAWVVFAVALVAFALDGVDGWLARRAALASDFGARFDMETDAGLGAVISLWLLVSGTTGPEILILGFMRYAFVAAAFVWPALQAPLPHSVRRKVVCVIQIGALILLLLPLTPQGIGVPVAIGAAVLLSWSFLVDILWLAKRAA
ncbi:CDP-alcohol phosphatidyltransferase family protein [Tateyamaria sp. syn59]|uniref:CDP-alcohol phosphatidyltransferase family protein n=1 Tax=Tateyamaria sp. syn59 TaxID=2576942 RepID=UPI001CB88CB3|nr:CDP-alcohol phosphatidyltransferase family protein [Tateyamaria sp. syn59]